MPRTGPIDSEDNASMKSARRISSSGQRAAIRQGGVIRPSADRPRWLKAQEEILTDQEGAAPLDFGGVLQGTNDRTEIGALRSELDEVLERTRRAETKVDTLIKPEDLMAAIAQLSSQMRDLPTTIEEKVNTAIDAKLPEAIQGCSTVIQENILQSMTLEVDGRIAERTAHFATHDALASVDGACCRRPGRAGLFPEPSRNPPQRAVTNSKGLE